MSYVQVEQLIGSPHDTNALIWLGVLGYAASFPDDAEEAALTWVARQLSALRTTNPVGVYRSTMIQILDEPKGLPR
jgi:hypothetical protein